MNRVNAAHRQSDSFHEELGILIGAEVATIRLGYDVTISFYGGQNRKKKYAELRINTDFSLISNKHVLRINPDQIETLPPLLKLLRSKIEAISLSEENVLSLAFDNGYHFTIKPAPKYEAWTLTGDDFGFYVATSA